KHATGMFAYAAASEKHFARSERRIVRHGRTTEAQSAARPLWRKRRQPFSTVARGGFRRPLLLLLLVRRQLLLAGQHEVAGAGLPPGGLVALAVVVAAGVVDQQLLLPLSDGVWLGDGGQQGPGVGVEGVGEELLALRQLHDPSPDRKSTRLNSS